MLRDWPTPIVFTGFEIGFGIVTGRWLGELSNQSAMARTYRGFNAWLADGSDCGRFSWDQTAVLYAVRGLQHEGSVYWTFGPKGTVEVDADGRNRWQASVSGTHHYLVAAMPPEDVGAVIDGLMGRP